MSDNPEAWLEQVAGSGPVIVVAPHGGRRQREVRPDDSVNDLHTAGIAREFARRLGAPALINHGLDRNDTDLNRISELVVAGQLASLVTALGAVFLLTTFMFRSFVAGLINVLPISLVMIFSFGLLGLLNIPLEIGKSMTSSMVIGIGIDYTIHFLSKYRVKVQEGLTDPAQITAATMATSGKAIFFNAVVVIGGFLIFLTSNFSSLFYLGAMLSLSMGACLIVSMTVLPAILNRFKPRFVYGREVATVE